MRTILKHKLLVWLMTMCLVLVAAGCSSEQIITPKDPRSMKYPVQVKDQTGQLTTIPKEPKRIVSLVPNATEIAFALKLDKEVVAVTKNDDYPAKVKQLPKVGDIAINIEQVAKQKPDLVLASTINDKSTIEQLRKLKIPVVVIEAKRIKQIYEAIDIIGQATNRTFEAEQLVAKMNKELRTVYGKVVQVPKEKRAKVWIELDPSLFTAGGDDFLNEVITYAGGVNVASKQKGFPKISPEQVVNWQPDVIISTYGGEDAILKRAGWQSIPAIKQKRVYAVDPNLTSRPGPRIAQGIEQIAKKLYPERFATGQK